MVYWAIAFWAAMVLATAAVLADRRDSRGPASRAAADDSRLKSACDLDHPSLFSPQFGDRSEWLRRADTVRRQVLVAEGLWPLPPGAPLHPVVFGRIDRDDYTIEKVYFSSLPGHYVTGNLYRPKNRTGKLPAVLCPHGHWPGGRLNEKSDAEVRQQLAGGGESTSAGARYPIQARCAMLARMGCVVFIYDMVGYADSTSIEHRAGFTDAEALLRLQSFMGLQTWNSLRALDFLADLPDVDPHRIGVTGASGGATQTLILCAIDPRPAVAFPAVMVSESMQGGCVCENAPLLRIGTNNVELAAVFAPKPLGMTAANDWTRDLETDGLPKLKAIYRLFGAEDEVMGKHLPFEHNYNQVSRELMYNWMNDHLHLGWPSPVKEKPFEPASPAELSVFDASHPRPADAGDARAVRAEMTRASDRRLAELLQRDPAQYRRVVTGALHVMVHDALPVDALQVTSRADAPRVGDGGLAVTTGTLSRRDAGEVVPFALLQPRQWDGSLVVWADPDGSAGLFDAQGRPVAEVRRLLDRGAAVIGSDLFLTGDFPQYADPVSKKEHERDQDYAGFFLGYNRGTLANRVHDLLTTIAFARQRQGARRVELVAHGSVAPAALLARALAGDAVNAAAIDLAGFDFDQIKNPSDPMLMPGALKYGGIVGFLPLCDSGRTLVCGLPADKVAAVSDALKQVTVRRPSISVHGLVDWLSSGTLPSQP